MYGNPFRYCMKTENNKTLTYRRAMSGKANRSSNASKINRMILSRNLKVLIFIHSNMEVVEVSNRAQSTNSFAE